MKTISLILFGVIAFSSSIIAQSVIPANDDYLSWTANQAESIGKSMRMSDRAGKSFDLRVLNTDHAINYKLRATLLSAEVIRAAARLEQIRNRLTNEQTRKLVLDAEKAGDIIVMIEIDPNEGSGVIPLNWRVFLQPKEAKSASMGAVPGIKSPALINNKALSGVTRRDYNYDVFWVVFPITGEDNAVLFDDNLSQLELVVGIYGKEGKVSWQMPESIRKKIQSKSQENTKENK